MLLGVECLFAYELGWLLTHRDSAEGALKSAMVLPFVRTVAPLTGTCTDEQGEACSWSEPNEGSAQGCLTTTAKMVKMPAINSTEIST